MRHRSACLAAVGLLLGFSACKVIDDDEVARSQASTASSSAGGVALALEVPGTIRPGEDATVRLTLANRADTAVRGVGAELFLPGWLEPAPPEATGTPVTMVTIPEGGTRLLFRMADSLRAGESRTVSQRIRIPMARPGPAAAPGDRTVRARLVGAAGEPLAEVQSQVGFDTMVAGAGFAAETSVAVGPMPAGVAGAAGGARDSATIRTEGIGSVRLGMEAGELRRSTRNVRDTTWRAEGTTVRGVVVPVGRQTVVAELADSTVTRLIVSEREFRTERNLGVGSTVEELRRTYGSSCAGVADGKVAIWFAEQPEVAYVLNTRPPRNRAEIERNPESLPDSATVTAIWVLREADPCPRS